MNVLRATALWPTFNDEAACCLQVCFAAIQQLCHTHTQQGQPHAALEAFQSLLDILKELDPPPRAMQSFWLGLIASLALPDHPSRAAFDQVSNLMHAWDVHLAETAESLPVPQVMSAELAGGLKALEASRACLAGAMKEVCS